MNPIFIQFLSLFLLLGYYYKKTKNTLVVWIVSYLIFFFSSAVLFRKLYPNIPFVSPTPEYMIFLVIVGVPFLALVLLIGVKMEERREKKEGDKDFSILFKASKDNIIFWTIVVLLNLIAFLIGNNK